MELDDLKMTWQDLDRPDQRDAALNAEILRHLKRDVMRQGSWRLLGLPLFELAAGVLATALLAAFLEQHKFELRFAVPALQLYLVALGTIVANAWQIACVKRLDYAAPAVGIQRQLAGLRLFRIRQTQTTFLLAPLLWVPFSIVAARALLGLDIYRAFGWAWIIANAAFGLAVIPLSLWAAHHFGPRLRRSSFGRSLADDIAGRSLVEAMGDLGALARFEREEPAAGER